MDKINYRNKINTLLNDRKTNEGLVLVEEYLLHNSEDPEVLSHRAMILGMLGRGRDALEAVEIAINADSDNLQNYHTKGTILLHEKKHLEAVKIFDQYLKMGGRSKVTKKMRIDTLILLGDYPEAVRSFENSDLPDLVDTIWWNNLGYMYLMSNDLEKAGSYLYGAKILSRYEPVIYFNLMKLWSKKRDYIRTVKYAVAYYLLKLRQKVFFVENKYVSHISESSFYSGGGTVYLSNRHIRETKSILKLLNSPYCMYLCDDTFQWFAVNIPYIISGSEDFNGDIDIIIKRPVMEGLDQGFKYRGIQVKTILVNSDGQVKSAKRGKSKHRKILKQLKILEKFGCEQIFLLELYVLERRYSRYNDFPSTTIMEEIENKKKILQDSGFGYIVIAQEPSIDRNEHEGGVFHIPINVLPAKTFFIKKDFQKLVNTIDSFRSSDELRILTENLNINEHICSHFGYCSTCKNLTMYVVSISDNYHCLRCKKQLI